MKFTNRLSFRLARNAVLIALFLGILLSLVQVLIDYLNEKSSLDKEIRAVISISHAPASQIAYNIDARLAEELLEGLLKHPAIVHAEIVDTDKRVLATRQRERHISNYRWLSDMLFGRDRTYSEALYVQQLDDVKLGDLTVIADTYPAGADFLQRAAFTLLSGFVRSLVLSAVLLILFYTMLTQPLLKVIEAVAEVDPDEPEKIRLPVPAGHEHDEIGVLVRATNQQLQAIEQSLAKLRQAESRLKGYSEQLEQIVEVRTKELSEKNRQLIKTNHDLRIAKEDAVRRAKSRADFLASMSHEIRTPFNGVLGMISLTLEEPLTDRQREQLNVAYQSGLALLELLNDILDISKVEAGKLTLEHIPFSLRKIVEDTARLLANNAHAKGIAVHTDIPPDFPETFVGDPTRMRQVISNLVSNAIKFTEEGHVTVRVRLDASGQTLIEVIDTGIGIAEDALNDIFSPFSQADAGTTRKYGGTGLGLTLCRHLVSHMHGQITVSSKVGLGSRFQVTLPLTIVEEPARDTPEEKPLAGQPFTLISRAGNPFTEVLDHYLRYWGASVTRYSYHTLESLDYNHLELPGQANVVIDSRALLPLINQRLKADSRVILTTHTHISASKEALEKMGIQVVLSAPFVRDRVLRQLADRTSETEPSGKDEHSTSLKTVSARILLVEDNRVNQMVARTILKKLGYDVVVANNGREALDILSTDHFDLILMDCHMPIMDGYEASRLIRQRPEYDRTPIIAVTANVMRGDKEKCFGAGMNDYITKPYEKDVLLRKLQTWLSRGNSAKAQKHPDDRDSASA
ncbi:MAG: response regulator [Gammaproteobacteria bacterium]|nr:MAG: response regulator [Gammaproteobacteria bacterium]